MANKNKSTRKQQQPAKKAPQTPRKKNPQMKRPVFGPISSINSAPVAIGNSVRGVQSKVTNTSNGVRVTGRDFALTAIGTGTHQGWTVACGMPLTPACMSSTALKQFLNTYAYYKINALVAHYITSSPTSTNGDVLLYFQKSRADPMVNWNSSNFLPFVMSDDSSIIGPQWTNQSSLFRPEPCWMKTDYITNETPGSEAIGDLFLFSKTSSTDSPGYVILDYEIEFKDLQLNIKNTSLPLARAQWTNVAIGGSFSPTINSTTWSAIGLAGNLLDGVTSSVVPSGAVGGEIYKCFIDIVNSTLTAGGGTAPTASNIFVYPNGDLPVTVNDGFTCYAVYNGPTTFALYATFAGALTQTETLTFGFTGTTATINLQCWMSLCGSQGSAILQSSI